MSVSIPTCSGLSKAQSRIRVMPSIFTFLVGIAIGTIGWGLVDQIWPLAILVALPVVWGASKSRISAWTLFFGYFMAGTRGLPDGAVGFFGETSPTWWGFAMWLCASMVLSAPFYVFWSARQMRLACGLLAALLLTTLPPLGIIGWVSPLSVAGVLFPGGGWLGLVGCLVLFFFLACGNYRILGIGIVLALCANFAAKDFERSAPAQWEGRDTHFSGTWSGGANQASQLLRSMERSRWLAGVIEKIPPGQTVVLPETLIGRWDGLIEGILSDAERSLRERGSRVLVGAEMSNGAGGYKNTLVVLGANEDEPRLAVQGLPVPISMWKPWALDGADANILGGENTIKVGQILVGASICYEQLVLFSMLRLMLDQPDVIAAVSNIWWATQSNIPVIQQQSIGAIARLFNIPVLLARNI